MHEHLEDIIADLDVLYVTRIQRERFPDPGAYASIASSYRVTPEVLEPVSDRFILMHPLPRVDEIDQRVDALPCARYFKQSRNGVPVRMAMLQKVLS